MTDSIGDSHNFRHFLWVNEFEEADVKSFYANFFDLESDPSVPIITVFIDSYGGNVNGMFAMRDLIKASEKPVATVCIGKAMSAGAFLLASGHKGLRFMSKDADVMIHESAGGFYGKNQEIQASAVWSKKMNHKILRNLAEDIEKPKKDIETQLHKIKNADWYLSAREAKKWGIVDHIDIPRIIYRSPSAMLVISEKKKGT